MKVFLDMDGVLVDVFTGINEIFNIPKPPHKYHWFEDYNVSREQMNKACDTEFFTNLNWMSDGKEILSIVLDRFPQNQIYLATKPMPNPGSWTGKFLWIKNQLPLFMKQLIITPAPKSLLAGPDTLLIDDVNENVEEFRIAGGQAILVPRPWNKNHDCQRLTSEYVAHKLSEVVI